MNLHIHATIQGGEKGQGGDVVLLHGLFGMGGNLGALARALAPDFRVHSLDLPNHGRSGWMESMGLAGLAAAVVDWLAQQGIGRVSLCGHSLGGKVAMRLTLDQPGLVDRLVVADIAPVAYPPHHDAIFEALAIVARQRPASRPEAGQLMAPLIKEAGVRQFLLLSLARGEDGRYDWRFNLEGLRRDYAAVCEPLQSDRPFPGTAVFLKGELSDYIQPSHREAILALFPAATVKVLQGCGHWLHAEQPRLFNATVRRFLLASGVRAAAG
ncbi:MAG: alpha/beta fold hydrolase [Parahaliea sp.]